MSSRTADELRKELNRLMTEQVESLRKQTYLGLPEEERQEQEARLKRIREVSADFIAALRRERS